MSAPGKGRGTKASPAVAPHTPASTRPSSTPVGSGEPKSPPQQNTSAPGTEAPTPEKVIPISSGPTEEDREGGAAGGAEAESEPRQLDLEALVRSTGGRSSTTTAQDVIGTSRAAPTHYRKKQYTHLPETDRWQLANDCTDILMQRVWVILTSSSRP